MRKSIALVGLGPHAMRIYYPYIADLVERDNSVNLELVVDLEVNKAKVEKFIQSSRLKPGRVIYLNGDEHMLPLNTPYEVSQAFDELNINRVIVSTEPKAHKVYLMECIRRGVPVVTDKPVTAPIGLVTSIDAASTVYTDVLELVELMSSHYGSRVLVQCQRRNHDGYKKVFDVAKSLIDDYQIPMTYISIHHSDGMWNMPDELFYRENHPYKYGYGKLMHSGYHFIDLLATLLQLNNRIDSKKPDSMTIFSEYSRAIDQQIVINRSDYKRFFGVNVANRLSAFSADDGLNNFGETDSYTQLQFSKNDRIITTAQLALIQSGFSQRGWPDLPEDSYKSNGRIRHEYINIHIGPLASIQVHSYQSKQINEQSILDYTTGGNNHFDIYVFRNSNLIGGEAFEKIEYGSDDLCEKRNLSYLGHNEHARSTILDELIYDLPSSSELSSHIATNKILSEIYKNHARQTAGDIPFSKVSTKEIL